MFSRVVTTAVWLQYESDEAVRFARKQNTLNVSYIVPCHSLVGAGGFRTVAGECGQKGEESGRITEV